MDHPDLLLDPDMGLDTPPDFDHPPGYWHDVTTWSLAVLAIFGGCLAVWVPEVVGITIVLALLAIVVELNRFTYTLTRIKVVYESLLAVEKEQ